MYSVTRRAHLTKSCGFGLRLVNFTIVPHWHPARLSECSPIPVLGAYAGIADGAALLGWSLHDAMCALSYVVIIID